MDIYLITISIVIYNPDTKIFLESIKSLIKSTEYLLIYINDTINITINDNSNNNDYEKIFYEIKNQINLIYKSNRISFIFNSFPANPGYGISHNYSILSANSKFHLILNPDVILEESTLHKLLQYMETNPKTDIVTPKVFGWIGENTLTTDQQFLIKRHPSILQLFLRGFSPDIFKIIFATTLSTYECKDLDYSKTQTNLEIVSGCFMFCKTESIKKAGGFDENFFLYFEDFDLSKRIARKDYFPEAIIYHRGGNASKKGWLHRKLFIQSAYQFFRKHGWNWF
jgi:GT2 family glycosyltransferase